MTRFVFITDTHLGAMPMGYQQQRGYPERLAELLKLLNAWISEVEDVDFVLHGGDMADECRVDLICEAAKQFSFSVPSYLCLGNHDLTLPDAVRLWMLHAPDFFVGGSPHYELVCPDVVVHVVPNHWDETDYCWDQVQVPRLSSRQVSRIGQVIAAHPDKAHVLCTHAQVFGISPEQTGLEEPLHDPGPCFRETILTLVERYPQIRCVLTGHNHINSVSRFQGAVVVSGSAFVEVPFEFKVVTVRPEGLSLRTRTLVGGVGFDTVYDYDKTFVQGRFRDRAFGDGRQC